MRSTRFISALAMVLLLLAMSTPVRSQVLISLLFGEELNSDKMKFGLDGGLNFTRLTHTEGSKFLRAFNLGLYFDIQLNDNPWWYVHTGALLKSDMGAKGLDVYPLDEPELDSVLLGGSIERQLKYIHIPALVRYRFTNHFFFEVGPVVGIRTKATDSFYRSVKEDEDLVFKNKVTSMFKWFDAGLEAGIGYHLMKGTGVNFGVRYYQGFVDILKDNTGDPVWNQSVYLFVSIPVGAGEKAQAKKAEKEARKGKTQ